MFVVRTSVLIFLDLSAATLRNRVFDRICGPKRNISKKPGFWPPCGETGFLAESAGPKEMSRKTRFLAPVDSEKPDFCPHQRAHTQYLEKTRFLAWCVLDLSAVSLSIIRVKCPIL